VSAPRSSSIAETNATALCFVVECNVYPLNPFVYRTPMVRILVDFATPVTLGQLRVGSLIMRTAVTNTSMSHVACSFAGVVLA
jgi:hypothetical protein